MNYYGGPSSAIALNTCPYCGNWHTGICPRVKGIEYDGNKIKRVEFHQLGKPAIGIEAIKLCIRCGNPALYPVTLPCTSKWDGEVICGNCIRELVDPAIDRANGVGEE